MVMTKVNPAAVPAKMATTFCPDSDKGFSEKKRSTNTSVYRSAFKRSTKLFEIIVCFYILLTILTYFK